MFVRPEIECVKIVFEAITTGVESDPNNQGGI